MNRRTRHAIIDIGSNSIRLVVFGGPPRAPVTLFNEKVMAGLGRGLKPGGRLDPEAVGLALHALARFAAILRLMQCDTLRVVATAAVREAGDGAQFLDQVRALGLAAEVLSGEDEAVAAGFGVIAAMPWAEGVVADLGGGSLELARVAKGMVHERVSLPFGAMRVAEIRAGGTGRLRKAVRKALAAHPWVRGIEGSTLYCVGGAWRALARVHMHLKRWPLPVLGNYAFPAADARDLKAEVSAMGSARLVAVPGVSASRALQLDDAAALLAALAAELNPAQVAISAFGLREGLLYQDLSPAARMHDPLIDGVEFAIGGQQQVPGYVDALFAWFDPVFADEPHETRRLRRAACLLAGTGWTANPGMRAVPAEDMALYGSWVGVTAADRAVLAQAVHVGLGGSPEASPELLARLAPESHLARACAWGFAIRLAQRLGGGAPQVLAALPLALADDGALVLTVPHTEAALADGGAGRRLARLALAMGLEARIESRPDATYAPAKSPRGGGRRSPAAA